MSRDKCRRRTLQLVVALAVVLGVLPAGLGAGSAAAREKPAMVLRADTLVFSPNGDGRQDRARYTVELRKRAKVTIKVLGPDGELVRGPVRLGWHRAGSTVRWSWNGRDNDGRRVPDTPDHTQRHTVLAKAKPRGAKAVTDEQEVTFHTTFAATLVSNVDDVYPRSTEVTDRVRFGVVEYDTFRKRRGTLQIRRAGGKVVLSKTAIWTRRVDGRFLVEFPVAWNGRDDDGKILPPGRYVARVKGQDHVGNRGTSTRVPITVSASRLVEATATADVSPAASRIPYYPCENSTANGCGDFPPCGDVVESTAYPSATDPGALSYRSERGCGTSTSQDRAVGWHALPRPPDSVRGATLVSVSMRGKPTNPGESDVAVLRGNDTTATSPATTEESTTTVEGTSTATPQDLVDGGRARWTVTTLGDDWFDVASFRVTYRYLTPAS
jgi:flagellar hook assembly protein FlgD